MKTSRLNIAAMITALLGILYPIVSIGIVQLHYAITSRNFSAAILGDIFLGAIPAGFLCILALLLALRTEGGTRMTGIVAAIVGGIINLTFLITVGASY